MINLLFVMALTCKSTFIASDLTKEPSVCVIDHEKLRDVAPYKEPPFDYSMPTFAKGIE